MMIKEFLKQNFKDAGMEKSFGPILFSSKFDSGNLANVEQVDKIEDQNSGEYVDYIFKLWTSPDGAGTAYENGNRTWFYFSIKGPLASRTVQFTIMNMNRQSRLYRQGLTPFFKSTSGKISSWQRIKERPTFDYVDGNFQLTFIHKFNESTKHLITYFAFCYPFSFMDCQTYLNNLEAVMVSPKQPENQDIYFHRDVLVHSVEGLPVDLLTVSSMRGITEQHEKPILGLYPDAERTRARMFKEKKLLFLTSRVHPGETQASFVFNGFLEFILRKNDMRACKLRDLFVFKLIPMLNPDGVKRGHYRTDSFGVNLNRTYNNPDIFRQPTIFAVKSLMLYHHFNRRDPKLCSSTIKESMSEQTINTDEDLSYLRNTSTEPCLFQKNSNDTNLFQKADKFVMNFQQEKVLLVHEEDDDMNIVEEIYVDDGNSMKEYDGRKHCDVTEDDINSNISTSTVQSISKNSNSDAVSKVIVNSTNNTLDKNKNNTHITANNVMTASSKNATIDSYDQNPREEHFNSSVDFYIDLHGHASKQGCFVYGNHFEQESNMVECMLYPKLLSLNSSHFDFTGCDFSEKSMYHKDKRDGLSKEGSGRVSIFKSLGIIHSYTLECNYNSGRTTNTLSPATGDNGRATPPPTPGFPPRYTTDHYQEVGRAAAISLLDFYKCNPWSRLPSSEYKTLMGVREWVTKYVGNQPQKPTKIVNSVVQEYRKVAQTTNHPSSLAKASSQKRLNLKMNVCLVPSKDPNSYSGLRLFRRVVEKPPSNAKIDVNNDLTNSNKPNEVTSIKKQDSDKKVDTKKDFPDEKTVANNNVNSIKYGRPESLQSIHEHKFRPFVAKQKLPTNKVHSSPKLLTSRLSINKHDTKPPASTKSHVDVEESRDDNESTTSEKRKTKKHSPTSLSDKKTKSENDDLTEESIMKAPALSAEPGDFII